MLSIQIYLDQELFEFVKKNKSKIIQQALKQYIEKQKKLKDRDSSPLLA
jgi:metal-responsive CopG/Arc/MetJ family transcriptional regulator